MSSDYEWCLSRQSVERLIQFPYRKRQILVDRLDRWAKLPHQIQGESLVSPEGRNLVIANYQGCIFTLWVDDAMKRLEILAIE